MPWLRTLRRVLPTAVAVLVVEEVSTSTAFAATDTAAFPVAAFVTAGATAGTGGGRNSASSSGTGGGSSAMPAATSRLVMRLAMWITTSSSSLLSSSLLLFSIVSSFDLFDIAVGTVGGGAVGRTTVEDFVLVETAAAVASTAAFVEPAVFPSLLLVVLSPSAATLSVRVSILGALSTDTAATAADTVVVVAAGVGLDMLLSCREMLSVAALEAARFLGGDDLSVERIPLVATAAALGC